jgi:transcriptional regulator with XRE-family HTH domain
MSDSEIIKQEIAKRIKKAREMAGLSQGQVAKILNIHRPTISEIEAGRRKLSADELGTFAKLYKVKISWLACEDDKNQNALSERVQLAARELEKLSPQDFDKVVNLINAINTNKDEPDEKK